MDLNTRQIADEIERTVVATPLGELDRVAITKIATNPQTSLDVAADAFLKSRLIRIVDVPIVSEEDPAATLGRTGICWVVDPIDGTINAIAGTNDFAVSVALVDAEHLESLLGVVYLPRTGQIYTAVKGGGASVSGRLLARIGDQRSPVDRAYRIASFGVPSDAPGIATRMSNSLRQLYKNNWVTRQCGSASVDICRVADGTWSAFFEYSLNYWDFAAAIVLAKEAGCLVRTIPADRRSRDNEIASKFDVLVARNSDVLEQLTIYTGIKSSGAGPKVE